MSLRNRYILPIITFFSLAFLVACGGSGTHSATPPPSGGFSNTNLNGTYTFSVAGADANGTYALAGSFVACGCAAGTISGGFFDFDDPTGAAPASAIGSNSTYQVSSDGRGSARLMNTNTSLPSPEIDVDFVLTSSSHGLIIQFDGNGTGSGTLDLQPNTVTQALLASTPYAFSLAGGDTGTNPLATVGAFTLDSNGNITAGVADVNYGATASTQLPLTGSVTVGAGSAPGTATLSTSFSTFVFDVYAIDSTHLKLVESDGLAILVGDMLSQPSASFPSGNLVFNTIGLDSTSNLFVTGGVMASDGTSLITSGSQDINDAGFVDNGTTTPSTFVGSFSSSGDGRYLLSMTGFLGGTTFAAYPSSGGLLLLQIDSGLNAGFASGIALTQQSGASIAASQGYGMNLTGEDVGNFVEVDEIAEFKTSSNTWSGLLDENDGGSIGTANFGGTYTTGTGGFGTATLSSGLQSMFFYAVDSSTLLFISTDPAQAALGSIQMQTTPTNSAAQISNARPTSLPMMGVIPHKRGPVVKGLHHILPKQ